MKARKSKLVLFIILVIGILTTVVTTAMPVVNGITLGLDLQGGFEVLYEAAPGQKVTQSSLYDAQQAIRKRIDVLGVTEPDISIEGNNRIRVQLAGVKDQKKARELLGKQAELTFRDPTGETVLLSGKDLKPGGAKLDYNQANQPVVTIQLKEAKKFEEITRKYIGNPIPIYLDDQLLSAPIVQEAIAGGSAQITGQETVEEAQELVDLLNAGAVPIKLVEKQSYAVDASLGKESLERSIEAGIYAILAIFIFVIGKYRLPGVIAVITLIAYSYLVLVVFYVLEMTLTLPGVAAFILGVGMAVDANIITSERIKEEIRVGRSVKGAVRAGSKRSFLTIFDANITTIIAAVVLFIFGTAGVKGFSVSLIAGISVSFLTAVGLSRLLINLLVHSNMVKHPAWFGVREDEISDL